MPFKQSVPSLLATLRVGSAEHKVITYLNQHAIGYKNAKPWDQICSACRITLDQRVFQQGLLARTRDGNVFIGSGSRGYFIIKDRDDAKVMATFYQTRIDREQEHLEHLKALIRGCGWPPI